MKKCNVIFCALLMIAFGCYSQNKVQSNQKTSTAMGFNLRDSKGLKTGLWIENKGLIEVYYKNNLRDGVYRAYNKKNGKLSGFGEYTKDMKSGTWHYFDEKSQLFMKEQNISINHRKIKRDDGVEILPQFKSYVILYYPDGIIKEEGNVLYDEDIEIDFFKTGLWKYYDSKGAIIKQTEEQ